MHYQLFFEGRGLRLLMQGQLTDMPLKILFIKFTTIQTIDLEHQHECFEVIHLVHIQTFSEKENYFSNRLMKRGK